MADHTPTFGDLCSAIAEGHVAATVDGGMYQLNALELRRYLNRFRPLPRISSATDPITSPHSDTETWTNSVQTSVA